MEHADLDGVTIAELAELAGVDRTTAMRWKSKRSRTPLAVLRLVALRVFGDLEAVLGAAWSGWRAGRDGLLYAPAWRRGYSPGEILAMPYLYGRIRALEGEARELARRRRLDFHHAGRRCRRRTTREQVHERG
jgi:transcriptional regulator with XRE-family HTH domain